MRQIRWKDWHEKAAYLDGCARLESTCEPVKRIASTFRSLPERARAITIHAWVRDRIHYRRDPNRREEFADCPTILSRRYDDCDGKSRVFCAICIAAGLEARIRPIVRDLGTPVQEQFEHVQAEVRYPGSNAHPYANAEGWIPVELILQGVPLGAGLESARRDAAGNLLYA